MSNNNKNSNLEPIIPVKTENHLANLIVYFDMDGVLFEYDRKDYTGKNPKFLRPGSHC